MRTRDFREILADDLQDPEFRREFIIACYEQDGIDGLYMALDEIVRADARMASMSSIHSMPSTTTLADVRDFLNQMGLDFSITRLQTASSGFVPA